MIARDELVKSTFSIVVCVCSGKSQVFTGWAKDLCIAKNDAQFMSAP